MVISVRPIRDEDSPPKPLKIATIWGRFGKVMREETRILSIAPVIIRDKTGIKWCEFRLNKV